jgi:hypothetical protein
MGRHIRRAGYRYASEGYQFDEGIKSARENSFKVSGLVVELTKRGKVTAQTFWIRTRRTYTEKRYTQYTLDGVAQFAATTNSSYQYGILKLEGKTVSEYFAGR